MINLSNIKSNKGARVTSKRLGRGNASGKGTYSGKGLKGQKCRSGVSNLKRIGLKSTLFSTPKKRGFNRRSKNETVYTSDLNKHFRDGDVVSAEKLKKVGLVKGLMRVKIILKGELRVSNLKVQGVAMSGAVKELLEGKKN